MSLAPIFSVLLGALAGLDRTAFGQTLLAHPLFAACATGLLLGDPVVGIWTGVCLAGLSAPVIPVGERGIRDWTSAAIVATHLAVRAPDDPSRGLALLLAPLVAVVGGRVIAALRRRAAHAIEEWRTSERSHPLAGAESLHLGLAGLHALRGALTVGLSLLLLLPLIDALGPVLPEPERRAASLLWMVAPVTGLPLLLRFHAGHARWPWWAAGLALGVVGVLVLEPTWRESLMAWARGLAA